MTTSDSLTLLRSQHAVLQKVFTKESVPNGALAVPRLYSAQTISVRSIDSLAELLIRIGDDPHLAVIRGALSDADTGSEYISRTKANFKPAERSWCMLDIDSLACPDGVTDATGYLKAAIQELPKEFHNVNFFYRFSSSMGVKAGIRVHLWFWLSRPCSDVEMKAWLADSPVDSSLFNPVQLHLTCSPAFRDGLIDPVKQRAGLIKSEGLAHAVGVPDDLRSKATIKHHSSKPRHRSLSGTFYPVSVVFDAESGLAIDGREQLMFQLSNECMSQLLASGAEVSADDLGLAIWEKFSAAADLTVVGGYDWSPEHARAKALDRIRQWQAGDFTYKSKSDFTTLLPADESRNLPSLLKASDASQQMNELLDSFFNDVSSREAQQLCVRVTMGLGKTTLTIEKLRAYLANTFGELVEVYVPRHDLAREWVSKLGSEVNADVVHVLPRTGGRKIDDQFQHPIKCHRADYVRGLEVAGYPIYRNACHKSDTGDRCDHYDKCEYLKQFQGDASPSNTVRIYTHQSLFLPKNQVEDQQPVSLMIVDESFLPAAVSNLPELTAEQLLQGFRTADKPEIGSWIFECLSNHSGRISYLTDEKGLTVSDLEAIQFATAAFATDFERTDTAVVPDNRLSDNLHTLREILVSELKRSELEVFQRVSWNKRSRKIIISKAKPTRFRTGLPTLYLDATLDEEITRAYMPSAKFCRIDVVQQAIVTQVHNRTGSNSWWAEQVEREIKSLSAGAPLADDNDLARLVTVMNAWVDAGESPLLVGHKKLVDFLRQHPGVSPSVSLAHFQSLRGSDQYKDCSVIFITGRNQPSTDDVAVQARTIFGSDYVPFTEESLESDGSEAMAYWPSKNYQGIPSAMRIRTFNDQRISRYQQQLRDAESVQAIARLRLVHSEYKKRVFLLSNLPLEIPVDSLIDFESLLPNTVEQHLLQHRHVALSAQAFARQSDLLLDSAKKVLKRAGANQPRSLLRFLPPLARSSVMLATYKAGAGRKTNQSHLFLPSQYKGDHWGAIFTPPSEKHVRSVLESLWRNSSEINELEVFPMMQAPGNNGGR